MTTSSLRIPMKDNQMIDIIIKDLITNYRVHDIKIEDCIYDDRSVFIVYLFKNDKSPIRYTYAEFMGFVMGFYGCIAKYRIRKYEVRTFFT